LQHLLSQRRAVTVFSNETLDARCIDLALGASLQPLA
jgi:hypothetical protein